MRADTGVQFADEIQSSLLLPVFKCESHEPGNCDAICKVLIPQSRHHSNISITWTLLSHADLCHVVLTVAKQAMFSLEPRVHFDDATRNKWTDTAYTDKAYLHSIVSVVGFYQSLARGLGKQDYQAPAYAFQHLAKALALVRARLVSEDDMVKLSDQTMMVIMVLAIHSTLTGQYDTAVNHLKGVRKIVDLRGGVAGLRSNTKLLLEIFRSVIFIDPMICPGTRHQSLERYCFYHG